MTDDRSIPRVVCAVDRGMCWLGDHDMEIVLGIAGLMFAGLIIFVNWVGIDAYLYGTNGAHFLKVATAGDIWLLSAPVIIDGIILVIAGYLLIGVIYGSDWRRRCQSARMRRQA